MIITKKNIFPDLGVARFNVTAWQHPESDHTILVGREVDKPGEPGDPDVGKLILIEIDKEGNTVNERVIWEPKYDSLYLEDPRALENSSHRIIIGMTAVLRTKTGVLPFPAMVVVDHQWQAELPPITLIQTFGPGKNITPFSDNLYLFRPEGDEYNHKLLLFQMRNNIPQKLTDIEFPEEIPWARWRIGTTTAPLWFENGQGILFIHGITKQNDKFIYSIGVSRLIPTDVGYDVWVNPEPLLTPDDFLDVEGKQIVEELRPSERRVVYACGGLIRRQDPEHILLYVNVGDKTTFEVKFRIDELEKISTPQTSG